MYSKEEAKRIRQEFWTSFGQYMSVIPSAEGLKVNWINYKTGIKHLYFRMDAENREASISIEIAQPDEGIRALMFEQFVLLKGILEEELQEEWIWDAKHTDEYGKSTAKIYHTLSKKSIFKKEDWPELISFFKPRMIALDSFWSTAQYSFEIFK